MAVTQLGYVGLNVTDIDAWRDFAGPILGMEVRERDGENAPFDGSGHEPLDAQPSAYNAPRLDGADAENVRRGAGRRDTETRVGRGIEGILRRIAIVEHDGLYVVAVRTDETIAPKVETLAVLRAAAFRANLAGTRIETEVAATEDERERPRFVGAPKPCAGTAGGAVDSMIPAPHEGVE